jgi:dihydroorotase
MPILKAEVDRAALVKAVTALGQKKFFLGTDSAPHELGNKHSACGCAGVFSAHASLEFYAEVFEDAGCLERLEAFASHNGADHYGFTRNTETVVLKREAWRPPAAYPFADGRLVPLRAGEEIRWKLQTQEPGFCATCK